MVNKEVEYLKEHLYDIYKYKKSMEDLTYDMDLEHLLRTCKALDYLQKEILKRDNIIKEVREYITYWHYRNDFRVNSFTTGVKEELLEILDKVDKEKEE